MPEEKGLDFTVENVGGVSRIDIKLYPGVNVLRGRNACGKTTTLRAISRASGGKDKVEVRDGSPRGHVRGPGVLLTLTKAKTIGNVAKAEFVMGLVSPIETLINPGYKDSETNAKHRLSALLELFPVQVTKKHMETLLADAEPGIKGIVEERRPDTQGFDLLAASEVLRKFIHAEALEAERKTEQSKGRIETLRESKRSEEKRLDPKLVGGRDLAPVDQLEAGIEKLTRDAERAEIQHKAKCQLESQQEQVRSEIGKEKPDPERIYVEVEKLRCEEERLRGQLAGVVGLRNGLDARLKDEQEALKQWERAQEILSQPVEGPTQDDITSLNGQLADDRYLLDQARIIASCTQAESKIHTALADYGESEKMAKALRSAATGIPKRLQEIFAEEGLGGLSIVGGRLAVMENGELKDFETRQSDGQRIKIALDLAVKACPEMFLPVSGAFYAALDPANKKNFHKISREKLLYVLTEEAADGDIRIEHESAVSS